MDPFEEHGVKSLPILLKLLQSGRPESVELLRMWPEEAKVLTGKKVGVVRIARGGVVSGQGRGNGESSCSDLAGASFGKSQATRSSSNHSCSTSGDSGRCFSASGSTGMLMKKMTTSAKSELVPQHWHKTGPT